MFDITQLLTAFRHLFTDKGYGESLHDYIESHNPQSHAEIELLERQWQYGTVKNLGEKWL